MGNKPNIFVSGLGRCGTTMVMTMLHAGGFPCVGTLPDFEVDEMLSSVPGNQETWLQSNRGKCIKWIDPTSKPVDLPDDARVIWLQRDCGQQAASQLKFLQATGSFIDTSRSTRRALAKSIKRDTGIARSALAHRSTIVVIDFEWLINSPVEAVDLIADFLADVHPIDKHLAAAVAIPRLTDCAPDMRIEIEASVRAA